MAEPLLSSPRSLRYRLMALGGTAFLIYLIVILLFLPLLHFTLAGMLDRTISSIETEKENEATTIARLMVLEFSHLSELLKVEPGVEQQIDQRVMRLLWEKVTFNEVIEGIELIHAPVDAKERHLTYWYYRREEPELQPMAGPIRGLKKFSGLERQLIDKIHREQWVDKNLLESVNLGPKKEGEMLLRYFPLYVPVPELGALYWGVAKIGIDAKSLHRIKLLQIQEGTKIRNLITLEIILSLVISGLLALAVVYWRTRNISAPLSDLSRLAYALEAEQVSNLDLWLDNLERVDVQGQVEATNLRRVLMRLAQTIQKLGQQLVTAEAQACRGRVSAAIFPDLKTQSQACQELEAQLRERSQILANLLKAYESLPSLTSSQREEMRQIRQRLEGAAERLAPPKWPDLAASLQQLDSRLQDLDHFLNPPEDVCGHLSPDSSLTQALDLIVPALPPEVKISQEIEKLPSIWGCQGNLEQAFLFLLDYARQELKPGGELIIQAKQASPELIQISLACSGPPTSEAELQRLLTPFQTEAEPPSHLGPALARAVFRQHGGDLTIKRREAGGLTFLVELPIADQDESN
ncbi:MAG: sensor histidine kinase [Desulfobacteraceae bacterium]